MPRINYGDPEWQCPKDGRLIPPEYMEQLKDEDFDKPFTTSFVMEEICTPYTFRKRPVSGDKFGRLQPTYFANSEIFSERIPQRKKQELGEICVNIFDDVKDPFLILVESTEKRKEIYEDYYANYLDVLAQKNSLYEVINLRKQELDELKKTFISRVFKKNKILKLEEIIHELELELIMVEDKLIRVENDRNHQYKNYISSYRKFLKEIEILNNKKTLKEALDYFNLTLIIPDDVLYFDEIEEIKKMIKMELLIDGVTDKELSKEVSFELKEDSMLKYLKKQKRAKEIELEKDNGKKKQKVLNKK